MASMSLLNTAASDATSSPKADEGCRFDQIRHYFPDADGKPAKAVDNVSLTIPKGQFLAIVGPSGCGKTTLLNMVAGMVFPTKGLVTVGGKQVKGPSRSIGYMTARDGLLPWRNARDNVAFGLEVRGMGRKERHERAEELLAMVGLGHAMHSRPSQLSQGMRQRVAIARTLAIRPEMFLLDEPFAALDAQTKVVIQEEFVRIWEHEKKTVLLVTHDINEAVSMSDRVVVMSRRPGRIRLDLTIDLPRPRDPEEVRFDPRFVDLTRQIWEEMREDVHGGPSTGGKQGMEESA